MTSSSQPGGTGGPPLTPPYSALLLAGFTWHPVSPPDPVSSYLTLSPLPVETGGLLSVALSLGSPPLVITQRPALRSPDFPPSDLGQTAIIWPTPTNLLKNYCGARLCVEWRVLPGRLSQMLRPVAHSPVSSGCFSLLCETNKRVVYYLFCCCCCRFLLQDQNTLAVGTKVHFIPSE